MASFAPINRAWDIEQKLALLMLAEIGTFTARFHDCFIKDWWKEGRNFHRI